MKCIDTLSEKDLRGKRVLLRSGLDVPLNAKGDVTDAFRIEKSLPTMEFLRSRGARVVILSKIGRDARASNAPVARALKRYIPVSFVTDLAGIAAQQAVTALREGELLLLENTQTDPREIAGDDSLAKDIANLGDIYVNDAFPSAHRNSATITGIPKFLPSYAGLLLQEEVQELSQARSPASPSFAILGGAKFETKEPLIRILLATYTHVFVCGALGNDVLKARGFPVGASLLSHIPPPADVINHPGFLAPVDVTVQRPDGQAIIKKPNEIKPDERIVDMGPDTLALIQPYISEAKALLWNGPTGIYEEGFVHWSHALAEQIAKSSAQKVLGGGDTLAVISNIGIPLERMGFLSSGGGASLEYLAKGTLPGVEALNSHPHTHA